MFLPYLACAILLQHLVLFSPQGVAARSWARPHHQVITRFYDGFFSEDAAPIMRRVRKNYDRFAGDFTRAHQSIEPYAIYFPQFHAIPENDINFYPGFTDMVNLVQAKETYPHLWTPLEKVLGFYDLAEDTRIVPTQIELAKSFGFYGFALYYFWFSTNTITGENMLFRKVIDQFFGSEMDGFSVFFVFCNENWSKNPGFTMDAESSNFAISNEYTKENIAKNMRGLVKYFKHANYRKINNKPVFAIHQPYEMTDEEIRLFQHVSDEIMLQNGFSGLEMIVDRRDRARPGYVNYYMHSNYKTTKENMFLEIDGNKRFIDYEKYIRSFAADVQKEDGSDVINSVFTNFNNVIRYYNHKNSNVLTTKTKGNSITLFKEFLDLQMKKYRKKRNAVTKIFLVNAWNEWGEQMVMEPSNEIGFLYLTSFQERLLRNFKKAVTS